MKMADLRVGAPLACGEAEEDDWMEFTDHKNSSHSNQTEDSPHSDTDSPRGDSNNHTQSDNENSCSEDLFSIDGFLERGKSGSLEDLVKTFDKKLSQCFGDYEDNVSNLAPVQIRTQDEIISNSQ